MEKIYYKPLYGRIYILLGIIFTVVFLAGTIILEDYFNLVYALTSAFMILIGRNMIKNPYVEFDHKTIILYSYWGNIREKHQFSSNNDLKLIKNRVFLKGKKLKFNSWFLRKNDWNRLLGYYELSSSPLEDVLLDDESSL